MIVWTDIEDALHAWMLAGSGLDEDNIIWSDQRGPRPEGAFITMKVLGLRTVGHDWVDTELTPLVLPDDVVEAVVFATDTLTLTAHAYLTGDGPLRWTTTGTVPDGLELATDYWAIKTGVNSIKLAASFPDAINLVAVAIDDAGTGTHTLVDTPDTFRAGAEVASRARGMRELTLSLQAFADEAHGASSPAGLLHGVVAAATLPSVRAGLEAAGIGLAGIGAVQGLAPFSGTELEPRAVLEVRAFLASEVSEFSTFIERTELTDELANPDVTFTVPA